jgi:hypothetical protein
MESAMCRHADATDTPTVFAVSLLFGGGGALVAAAFGLHGGAGFIAGATLAFLPLSVFVHKRREAQRRAQEPLAGTAENGPSRTAASSEPLPQ